MSAQDLTRGRVLPTLLSFTLPYLLASFLQTFYGMADLLIVGQFCDTAAVNAVSVGSQFMHMLTVIIIGLAMGATVRIGHLVGEKKTDSINQVIQSTVWLFGLFSVFGIVIFCLCTNGIVTLIQTPAESAGQCGVYLIICFLGLPFICFYNVFSSIFRGLGDSKSPMFFIAIACVINVGLDILFVGPMHMGVAGAALATVIAQGISAVVAVVMLKRKNFGFEMKLLNKKPDWKTAWTICKLGGPIATQDGLIQVAFMVITIIANSRGLVFATGVGITEKIISFLFLVPSAFLSSLSAIVAQNQGAGLYARSRKMLFTAMAICCSYGLVIFIICQFAAEGLLSLFSKDAAVVAAGADYLRSYSVDTCFAGCNFCFCGYFAGIQKPGYSFINNVISALFIRIPGSYLAMVFFPNSLYPMGLAAPAGSLVSCLICLGFYLHLRHQSKQGAVQTA